MTFWLWDSVDDRQNFRQNLMVSGEIFVFNVHKVEPGHDYKLDYLPHLSESQIKEKDLQCDEDCINTEET